MKTVTGVPVWRMALSRGSLTGCYIFVGHPSPRRPQRHYKQLFVTTTLFSKNSAAQNDSIFNTTYLTQHVKCDSQHSGFVGSS